MKEARNSHGGRRPGAGRKKGVVAETKRSLAETAREYGPRMLKVLVDIAADPEQPASSRVSAANHILERGYGKPVQLHDAEPRDTLAEALKEISRRGSAVPVATARVQGEPHAPTSSQQRCVMGLHGRPGEHF